MNGKYFVGKKVSSFEAYHPEDPITGVRLTVDQSNAYFAGDMDGNVWEMHCPYGTQQMADNILSSLRGQVYKGFEAQDAALSPEAELGDGITVNGLYTSLGYRKVEFGPGHFSTVSAPGNNEPDEEYKYLGQKDRDEQYSRADTYSYIEKTSEEIKLGVKNDMEKQSADFTVQLGNVQASLKDDINGVSSDLTLKYDNLSAHFEDSQKQQTADFNAGLDGLKFNLEDQLKSQKTTFEADLAGIRTRVEDTEKGVSTLEQTATSITSMVTSSAGTVGDDLVEFAKVFRTILADGGTDGQIDAWFYSGQPTANNRPASTWTTTSMRTAHNYDVYYDTSAGKMYFYYLYSGVGVWVQMSTFEIETAMKKASKAHDTTSDNLRRVFMKTPTPPYSVGDLWYRSDTQVYRCKTDKASGSYLFSDWEDAKNFMDNGLVAESKIEQFSDSITLSVTSNSLGTTLSLKAGSAVLTSQEIALNGVVKFINDRAKAGTTTINGGAITANSITATQIKAGTITATEIESGTITADKLAAGAITAGSLTGEKISIAASNTSVTIGGISVSSTTFSQYGLEYYTNYGGIRMAPADLFWVDSSGGNFGTTGTAFAPVFQITADCLPTNPDTWDLGSGGNRWSAVYAATSTIQSSDERYKNSIESVPDKYIAMLDKVEPVIYRLNSGESGRLHAGFVSQQVKEAMDEAGVDSTEFGGFVIAKDGEGNDFYMLRYEEFIAPMLAKMRQLEQRIKVLEGT